MTAAPDARNRRALRCGFVLAVGIALGFAGHHALRAADLAVVAPASSTGPSSTVAPTTTPAPTTTTEAPSTTSTTDPPPTTPAPTSTEVPTTTTTEPPAAEATPTAHRPGDRGAQVAELQTRLLALGFWLPGPDGHYGELTSQAVLAFQKHAGLARDGIAGPATLAALDAAAPVTALESGDHAEIDLERQLLLVVRDGATLAFNTSTGTSGWRTPTGRFAVTREIDGIRRAPLGDLYRPKYFHGGIAVHGSPSIPGHPASHGCARVHDTVMDLLWDDGLLPVGTPVWVR